MPPTASRPAAPAAAADPEAEWAELRRLAEAVPERFRGPWYVFRESHGYPEDGQLYIMPTETPMGWEAVPGVLEEAAYVAYVSPDRLLRLLSQVKDLERERDRLRLIETEARDFIELHDGEDHVDPTWPCTGQCIQARGLRAALSAATGHGDPAREDGDQ